jgi:hypothetical protein
VKKFSFFFEEIKNWKIKINFFCEKFGICQHRDAHRLQSETEEEKLEKIDVINLICVRDLRDEI